MNYLHPKIFHGFLQTGSIVVVDSDNAKFHIIGSW